MSARSARFAFVGGTGKEGRGLALRLAAAGHPVLIGSRSQDRAKQTAQDLRDRLATAGRAAVALDGAENLEAIAQADVVFLALPFAAFESFLSEGAALLAGKIVIDVVVPVQARDGRFELKSVAEGSVSALLQTRVPRARVVGGFKNVAALDLLALDRPASGDVLLVGDDEPAKEMVAGLVRDIPDLRPVDAGPLAYARYLESLTVLQLNLNRLHKARTSIRILGVE